MKRLIIMLLVLLPVSSVNSFRIKAQNYMPVSSIQIKINLGKFKVSRFDMKLVSRDPALLLLKEIVCIVLKNFVEEVRECYNLVSKERKFTIFSKDKSLNLYSGNYFTEVNGSKVKISKNSSVKPIIVNLRRLISIEFLLESLKDGMLKEQIDIHTNIIPKREVIVL